MAGVVTDTVSEGPCYRCLFPTTSAHEAGLPNCQSAEVLATLPGLMGVIQATEVIKCYLKLGRSLLGNILQVNGLTACFNTFSAFKDPECVLCGYANKKPTDPEHCIMSDSYSDTPAHPPTITSHALREQLQSSHAVQLIDVRQPKEHDHYNLGGRLIPLDQLEKQWQSIDPKTPVVVYCQKGIRSASAAAYLLQQGLTQVVSLKGGVEAWLTLEDKMR